MSEWECVYVCVCVCVCVYARGYAFNLQWEERWLIENEAVEKWNQRSSLLLRWINTSNEYKEKLNFCKVIYLKTIYIYILLVKSSYFSRILVPLNEYY